MNHFNLFKPRRYDMDTLEGINAIPVPAKNYNAGSDLNDRIYYILQRKATEHKKNGRMDLAIACLRKSNELSDYQEVPLLSEKDYLRLVKYIRLTGDHSLANNEEQKIYQRHPEFKDKRLSNIKRIHECLKNQKRYRNDFVLVSTNNSCPICNKYNLKIYSISGKSKKYPKLPHEITDQGGFCPNCRVSLCSYFDGISTPPRNR